MKALVLFSISESAGTMSQVICLMSSQRVKYDYSSNISILQRIDGMDKVCESYCCVLALWSQCQWRG